MSDEMVDRFCLAPLRGKYYGTQIIDADGGRLVAEVWQNSVDPAPSPRELEAWGDELFEAYDSHYESMGSYRLAVAMVKGLNAFYGDPL